MKIAVVGGRSFNNYSFLKNVLHSTIQEEVVKKDQQVSKIISGGATGTDLLAEKYASEFNLETTIFLPNWKKFGKSAGVIRNQDIIQNSDIVVAFWNGISRGTKSSIELSKKYKKKLIIARYL